MRCHRNSFSELTDTFRPRCRLVTGRVSKFQTLARVASRAAIIATIRLPIDLLRLGDGRTARAENPEIVAVFLQGKKAALVGMDLVVAVGLGVLVHAIM